MSGGGSLQFLTICQDGHTVQEIFAQEIFATMAVTEIRK